MTVSKERKGKDAPLACYTTSSTKASQLKTMVIISSYELVENPNTGVFCSERRAEPLPLLWW
jgi:hypothetical protein